MTWGGCQLSTKQGHLLGVGKCFLHLHETKVKCFLRLFYKQNAINGWDVETACCIASIVTSSTQNGGSTEPFSVKPILLPTETRKWSYSVDLCPLTSRSFNSTIKKCQTWPHPYSLMQSGMHSLHKSKRHLYRLLAPWVSLKPQPILLNPWDSCKTCVCLITWVTFIFQSDRPTPRTTDICTVNILFIYWAGYMASRFNK